MSNGAFDGEWTKPQPFTDVATPAFPVESLPGAVGAFVEQLAESTQTPEEMAGVLSLGIMATAFQRQYSVEVTPDWVEPLSLFTVAVAAPGERKSAVISALTGPVYEFEAEQREIDAVEVAQNQTERAMLEKALQAAQAAATKKGDYAEKRKEALDLSAQLASFHDLHETRLLVDDTTPEKLTAIMEEQGGSIAVASAEGGLFDAISGRYDRQAGFDVYLKGHAGDHLTVDRIGRRGNYVAHPHLTLMLTIQPQVLHGLMDNSTFRGRGLCGRFLYAVCKSKVGERKVSPAPVPTKTKMEYRQFVRRILADQGSGVVKLSQGADEVRRAYQEYIEKKLGGEWDFMADWGNKLVGAMVRIAALLHLSSFPVSTPISPETMAGAVAVAEFLAAHAEAAYTMMGADETQENARYILKRIATEGKDKLTRSELTRLCRGRFKRAEDMDAALAELVERGYIRERGEEIGYNNRRQVCYDVNPFM